MSGVIFREASKGVYMGVHDRRRPKGVTLKILYTSRKGTPESAPRRGLIGIILFPQSITPYEKSLYVRTSFSIRFCFREQLKFSYFSLAGRK